MGIVSCTSYYKSLGFCGSIWLINVVEDLIEEIIGEEIVSDLSANVQREVGECGSQG